MGYYDIDEILAESQKVPCRFEITVPGLGYLENNPGNAIEKGAKLELPYWLAQVLAICGINEESEESFISLLPPDFTSARVINAIKSSPTTLDLHQILPYYYTMMKNWCHLFNEEQLKQIVMEMLKERAVELNNHAQNHSSDMFLKTLDEFEKRLFKLSNESYKDLKKWVKDT